MILKKATIHKYKSVEKEQSFNLQEDVTVLVGMNESGKTSILEVLAKTNYFQSDAKFQLNSTHDYPRKEKKALDKSGKDALAITCIYEVSEDIKIKIIKDFGKDVFNQETFSISKKYSGGNLYNDINANLGKFIENKTNELAISPLN